MATRQRRTVCWTPLWNERAPGVGLEHLLLAEQSADGCILAVDEATGPFRLSYLLTWDESWRLREAKLALVTADSVQSLSLQTDGRGQWWHADGRAMDEFEGCIDIDIWPTPFTNSFPIRREPMKAGERRQFRMAWVYGPALSCTAQDQAYTRLADRLYLFEHLDGSGFQARLSVDDEGVVIDYPGFFKRVPEQRE